MNEASLNDVHTEMNVTKGVRIGVSRGDLESGNDIRFFLIIAQQTR